MARARITFKSEGFRQVLTSQQMLAELARRADRVRQAADIAANDPGGHVVLTDIGRNRARAAVLTNTPKSMWKEAVEHSLTRSFGAARG
jgi:hypothetical protein